MSDLAPGKGVHLILNEQVLEFLRGALNCIDGHYSDEVHDVDPGETVGALQEEESWVSAKDKFGTKAYAAMPYKKGELRVTVVLTSRGELKLDVREWFDPNAA